MTNVEHIEGNNPSVCQEGIQRFFLRIAWLLPYRVADDDARPVQPLG